MKTPFTNPSKFRKVGFLILAATLTIFTSCSEEESISSTNVTGEEAAEVVFAAIDSDTDGINELSKFSNQLPSNESGARYAATSVNFTCGVPQTYSLSQDFQKTTASLSYDYLVTWTVNCTNTRIPSSLIYNLTGSSSYNSPRMKSQDESVTNWTFSGIEPSAMNYSLSLDMLRNGTQTSLINEQKSFSSQLTLISENLTLAKTENAMLLGTMNVTISGSGSNNESYSYGGTLELQSTQLVITFSNGQVFTRAR